MEVCVTPSPLRGILTAPPSKSVSHRLLFAAALCKKPCKIRNITLSEDVLATIRAFQALGKNMEPEDDSTLLLSGEVSNRNVKIDCGESGSTLRFLIPVLAALGIEAELTGHGKLPSRPLDPIIELLSKNGIEFSHTNGLPLRMKGKLQGSEFSIRSDVSSQFITGLLFAAPILERDLTIQLVGKRVSQPYLDITVDVLRQYGIMVKETEMGYQVLEGQDFKACDCAVEGDYSNAAFFLCAGAMGILPITINGLNPQSYQGDREILSILHQFGAEISNIGNQIQIRGGALRGITIDAENIPDLIPILSVVAAFAEGDTVIENAGRLRIKECDRLSAVSEFLTQFGAKVWEYPEKLVIRGSAGIPLRGGCFVSAHNDHRIAMAEAVAAAYSCDPVTISSAESVKKSYPAFYEDFNTLGGNANVIHVGK